MEYTRIPGETPGNGHVTYGNGHLSQVPTQELLNELKTEGTRFARAEIELMREELKQEARTAAKGAAMAGAGGAVLYVALFCLAAACIALLALVMPVWASALIVTALFGAIGAGLAMTGRDRIKEVRPQQTINELKEDARWLRQTTRDVKARRHVNA